MSGEEYLFLPNLRVTPLISFVTSTALHWSTFPDHLQGIPSFSDSSSSGNGPIHAKALWPRRFCCRLEKRCRCEVLCGKMSNVSDNLFSLCGIFQFVCCICCCVLKWAILKCRPIFIKIYLFYIHCIFLGTGQCIFFLKVKLFLECVVQWTFSLLWTLAVLREIIVFLKLCNTIAFNDI